MNTCQFADSGNRGRLPWISQATQMSTLEHDKEKVPLYSKGDPMSSPASLEALPTQNFLDSLSLCSHPVDHGRWASPQHAAVHWKRMGMNFWICDPTDLLESREGQPGNDSGFALRAPNLSVLQSCCCSLSLSPVQRWQFLSGQARKWEFLPD